MKHRNLSLERSAPCAACAWEELQKIAAEIARVAAEEYVHPRAYYFTEFTTSGFSVPLPHARS